MASGDSVGSKSENSETLKGSEETFSLECDACKLDGSIQKAAFFCKDCDDYLCKDCELHHKKVKLTRSHEILSEKEIPQQSQQKHVHKGDTEQHDKKCLCSCNQKVAVEFYCTDDNEVFCAMCKNVRHKKCQTTTIDESCKAESFAERYEATIKQLDALIFKALGLEEETEEYEKSLMQTQRTCEDEIRQCGKDFHLLIDKLEQNALKDVKSHVENLSDLLQDRKATIRSTLQFLNTDKSSSEESKKDDNKQLMFVACNKIDKSLQSYETALEECQASMIKPSVIFEKNSKLIRLHNELEDIGKVSSTIGVAEKCNLLDAEVKADRIVKIKESSNYRHPWITGIAFLKNGELIVADYNNEQLRLFDSAIKSCKRDIKCSSAPWDIAVYNDKEAIVTFPAEKKLQYLNISDTLSYGRVIKLTSGTYGITVLRGLIYVSLVNDENVLTVLDKSGNILQSISRTQIGFDCSSVIYIRHSVKGEKLYIQNGSRISCCTTAGKGLFAIKDSNMNEPRGLFVDDEDNVLVCCHSSKNIHVFKPDGAKHKTLLSSDHSISKLYSIAFRPVDRTLVVGDWDKGYLHVLTLSY